MGAGLFGLTDARASHGDVLVVGERRWSSDELTELAARCAGGLVRSGVAPGDRVAFLAPSTAETVVLYRACWHLGAVPVALHDRLGAAVLRDVVGRVEPKLTAAPADSVLPDPPRDLALTPETWRGLTSGDPIDAATTAPEAPALIMFTSGSTGRPKGVVHAAGGLEVKAVQTLDVHDLGSGDAVLMPAPLAHVSGLLHGVLLPAVGGVKAVLMNGWDAGIALDLIEAERITYMVGPPTFFVDLMEHPSFASDRVESLRFLSCGGTGVTAAFAARAADELGCRVKRSYGSTEAPTVTTSRNDDSVDRMIATDGRARGATEVRIGGLEPGADGEGELWVRGPELAIGYLDEPDDDAFVDGWFRTGDVGRLDDGWLTITGRLGDRIIRGGENIDPTAVAAVVESHPSVRQAVVVGVPDDRLGERIGVAVVAGSDFDLVECRRWFESEGAGRLLTPERLLALEALPTLPSGKPDRTTIIAMFPPTP